MANVASFVWPLFGLYNYVEHRILIESPILQTEIISNLISRILKKWKGEFCIYVRGEKQIVFSCLNFVKNYISILFPVSFLISNLNFLCQQMVTHLATSVLELF